MNTTKLTSLLIAFLLIGQSLCAQEGDYRALWARGAYSKAVEVLARRPYLSRSVRLEYAALLALTGRVDRAIEELEGGPASAPDVTLRPIGRIVSQARASDRL